jgi:hypothetical protein
MARLAAARHWSQELEGRRALAEDAIAMARRVRDPATLALVLGDAHLATLDPDSLERSLGWASEIYALAGRLASPELSGAAHWWRMGLLLERGDVATVDRESEFFAQAVEPLRQPRTDAYLQLTAPCAPRSRVATGTPRPVSAGRPSGRGRCSRWTPSCACAWPAWAS